MAAEGDGYESAFFDRLSRIEDRNWWFQSRNRLILQTLAQFFPQARNVLEIGCGTGFVLRGFAEAGLHVTGTELFPHGIELARRRLPDADFVQADARRLPYRDAFDVVGAFDVLEHISQDETVLSEMAAATRPGGGVMITVPQHPWLWSKADTYAHHKRRYSRRGLMNKVREAGLTPLFATSFVSLALPTMAAARWVEKRSGINEFDPMAEFRIPRPVNGALDGLARVECALIHRGVSLPAGGSLLVAARRDPG